MAGAAKPIGARQFFSLARAAVPFRRLAAANQRRRFCGQVRSSGRTKRTGCEFPLSTVFSFVFPSESNSKLARNSDLVKAAPSFTGPFFYYCRNLSRSVNWNVFSLSFFLNDNWVKSGFVGFYSLSRSRLPRFLLPILLFFLCSFIFSSIAVHTLFCALSATVGVLFCFFFCFFFVFFISLVELHATRSPYHLESPGWPIVFFFRLFSGPFFKKNCCRFVNVGYFVILVVFGTVHRCSEKGPVPRRFFHWSIPRPIWGAKKKRSKETLRILLGTDSKPVFSSAPRHGIFIFFSLGAIALLSKKKKKHSPSPSPWTTVPSVMYTGHYQQKNGRHVAREPCAHWPCRLCPCPKIDRPALTGVPGFALPSFVLCCCVCVF